MEVKGRQHDDGPGPLRICRCALDYRLLENVLRSRQTGQDAMHNPQPVEFAAGIVCVRVAIGVGAAEQTRQTAEASSIGGRIVDMFKDPLEIGQDFLSRSQRVEI